MGFWVEDNPVEWLEGEDGHDFLVADDNIIIDLWLKYYVGELDRCVFDLREPEDHDIITEYYGDRDKWQEVVGYSYHP